MRKLSLFMSVGLMASMLMVGCTPKEIPDATEAVTESVVETEELTETEASGTEAVDATKEPASELAEFSTGELKEYTGEATDEYGNTEALFVDETGNEFIAILSNDTELPSDFEVGKIYDVYHSDIQTMSIPGKYPEVYKIVEVIGTGTEGETDTVAETDEIIANEEIDLNELTEEEIASLEATE